MDDDTIAQFTAITSASPDRAQQYLQVSDGDIQQAVQLFFENDGASLSGGGPAPPPAPRPPQAGHSGTSNDDPVTIDSDGEDAGAAAESDEAMARRLQDEMYGGGGPRGDDIDPETGVRAPMARQAETLAGPGAAYGGYGGFHDEDDMRQAIAEQMAAQHARRAGREARPGIFNQQHTPDTAAIWDDQDNEDEDGAGPSSSSSAAAARRAHLSRATGGASDSSSKSSMLAEMYRPPTELIAPIRTWEGVRSFGKENNRWILVNVQDPNVFDCQVLNRDVWKNKQIQETVREHFVFKQYARSDPQAQGYVRLYFHAHDSDAAYPHIAIVDPRTGEQVKVWSGAPVPKAPDFLMQLHEFLDRYSLAAGARNPVAVRRPERKPERDPDRLTEDEQLQLAMAQSLAAGGGGGEGERRASGPRSDDPDALTRAAAESSASASASAAQTAPTTDSTTQNAEDDAQNAFFASLPSTPHAEPPANDPRATRIQFRHAGGRVIRRFSLDEPVASVYGWLKGAAPSPLGEERTGLAFELVSMGRNLQGAVEKGESVEAAGLKMGTVMVEFS